MGRSSTATPGRLILVTALVASLIGCAQVRTGEPGFGDLLGGEMNREFGITTDPWQVDEWAEVVGAKPSMVMEFEQWGRRRTLDTHFEEARRQGLSSFMVTWEPWVPVPVELGLVRLKRGGRL